MLFALACAVIWQISAQAAERQVLPGHVPAAVADLQATGKLPATNQLQLAFGLPWRNREALTNLLQRLYDPASPDYHQFLTPEQFAEQFGPSREDYQALSNHLAANGLVITGTHSNRTLLDASGSAADIEKLLGITLRVYPHPRETRTFFAPDTEPSLDLAVPVLHISGLDDFVRPHPMSLKAVSPSSKGEAVGSGPGGSYMGNDFRAAYVPGTTLTGTGQVVGLLEFDGYFSADITAYRNLAGLPDVPLKNVLLDEFNGVPGGNNDEVALDIDMATCMAPGLSAIIVYEGETTDDILNRMATDDLAKQLSASWTYPIDSTSEQIFQQFGAQGQSFFNASGDSDAYYNGVPTPADDPNITVVGGTTLTTTGPGGAWVSETVWNWGNGVGGSGGISTTYPIPSWQQGISMALNNGSTNMRNLPDVALTGDNVWVIYDDGATGVFGGTSCATPLWAAFIALANQQALANGRGTMGFINPAVYTLGNGTHYAAGFHDITTGNNTSPSSPANFYAVAGYDLCTGWGTPNGTNLINLLAPPDALDITPANGFTAVGGAGGPFTTTSQTYLLTNSGASVLNWSAGSAVPWLDVSPASGALQPGGSATAVTVSLNTTASNEVAGAYSGTVRFTNLNDGVAQSRAFTLDVLTAPQIVTGPSNESVLGGATVVFSSQVIGGEPLSFQWRQNGTNLANGVNISGSATTALTIGAVAVSNTGSYVIVASNAAGTAVSTPPAVLSITPSGPVITQQPAGQSVLLGASATLTVAALGSAPLSYQWQQNGVTLAGATATSLTLGSATATNAGTYTVIVSNSINSVTSAPASFNVYALAATQLVQNGGFETGDFSDWNLLGNTALDSVSSGGLYAQSGLYGAEMGTIGSLGYLSQTVPTMPGSAYLLSFWLDSPDGATPNEFTVLWNGYTLFDQTNLSAFGWSNFQFVVTATAASTAMEFGFRDDSSFLGFDNVSLQPLANPTGPPVITAQPAAQMYVVAGAAASLNVGAAGLAPLSYQWLSNNISIPNATNATLSWTAVAAGQGGVYSVIVSNTLGKAASSNAVLTVLQGNQELVTFDDLGSLNALVPNGYAGLDHWSNFSSMDPSVAAPNPSGYIAGTISQPDVAYNGSGLAAVITNATPFDFLSAWMTAAWNNNLRLEVRGCAGNALVFDNAYTLSATTPELINFDCVGVTNLEFITSGGESDTNYGGSSGEEFVMDNATIVTAPVTPPANDTCGNAIVVTSNPYSNVQSTLGATNMGNPLPSCLGEFTNAVWYRYTPSASGQMSLSTAGSDFPAVTAVYSGTCGSLTPVACNESSVAVNGGTTYYILAGAQENAAGTLVFQLSLSSATTGPPFITVPPTNISAPAGGAATFTVTAEGTQPLNYLWQSNGAPIAGATASTCTISNVPLSASGAQFSCLVSNALGSSNSAAATLTVTAPGQLVQNGGFETGDFSDWTLSGNTEDTYVSAMYVHSGRYGASLGPAGSLGYLSQTLPTSHGQLYQISLWLYIIPNEFPNEFSVSWNGATLFDQVNLSAVAQGWSNLLFTVPATATDTPLQIGFRNDPSFFGLDDVSVLPLKPVLQNVTQGNGSLTFNWSAMPGSSYQIQTTTNLSQTNWTPLGAVFTASNYTITTTETISNTPRFYRVVLDP